MHILRTRFKKDIVAEFVPPTRKSNRVIIYCDGMPTVPKRKETLLFWAKKGFWVFHPRYRGTWESNGKFLQHEPTKDILDVIDSLPKGFADLHDKKTYKITPSEIYLFAGSFGGPAGIIASKDPRVTKVVAISPITDMPSMVHSKAEPLDWLNTFVQDAFGQAYRYTTRDWNKMKHGTFYNPEHHKKDIDGNKLMIIHAKDDKSIAYAPVARFAHEVDAELITLKTGGHLSSSITMTPRIYKKIRAFMKKK